MDWSDWPRTKESHIIIKTPEPGKFLLIPYPGFVVVD